MKEITKYVATDGKEFYEKEKCLSYEDVIAEVAEIMRDFPPEPQNDGCAFANGGGYIQHKSSYFSKAKSELLALARRFSEHDWLANADAHPSYAHRIIGELGLPPLDNAWQRIHKTDKLFREWGQVYFVEHPNDAKKQVDIYSPA